MFFKQKFDFCWWLWQQHLLINRNIYQPSLVFNVCLHYRHAHGRSVCMLVDNSRPIRIRTTYTVIVYVFTYTFLHIRSISVLYIHFIYILYIRSIYTFYLYIFLYLLTSRSFIYLLFLSYLLYLPLLITLLKLHSIPIYLSTYLPTLFSY